MQVEGYLLPEPDLITLITACRAVGLEPAVFQGDERACDSDVLADFISQPWLPEPSALHALESLDHALHELRKNLKTRLKPDHVSLEFELEPRPELGGEWRMSTARLLSAFNARLLKLVQDRSSALEDDPQFEGLTSGARLIWPKQPAQLTEQLLAWLPGSGLPGCQEPGATLGAPEGSLNLNFRLALDIGGYSYGVPALESCLARCAEDPDLTKQLLGDSSLFEWQRLSEVLSEAFRSSRSPHLRLGWVIAIRHVKT